MTPLTRVARDHSPILRRCVDRSSARWCLSSLPHRLARPLLPLPPASLHLILYEMEAFSVGSVCAIAIELP